MVVVAAKAFTLGASTVVKSVDPHDENWETEQRTKARTNAAKLPTSSQWVKRAPTLCGSVSSAEIHLQKKMTLALRHIYKTHCLVYPRILYSAAKCALTYTKLWLIYHLF